MKYTFIELNIPKEPLKRHFDSNIVVYTCNYNSYDYWTNINNFPFVKTVVFTNQIITNEAKNIQIIKDDRDYKWLRRHSAILFPDADYTIYHDCNLKLKLHPFDIIKNIQLEDLAVWKNEDCVYRKDDRKSYLQSKRLPVGFPSYDDKFIIRRNTKKIKQMEKLWEETKNLSLACFLADVKPILLAEEEKVFNMSQHKNLTVPIIWGLQLLTEILEKSTNT